MIPPLSYWAQQRLAELAANPPTWVPAFEACFAAEMARKLETIQERVRAEEASETNTVADVLGRRLATRKGK